MCLSRRLVDALMALMEASARWREAGGSADERASVAQPVAHALGSLKLLVRLTAWHESLRALQHCGLPYHNPAHSGIPLS